MSQQPLFPISDWQAAAAQKREKLFNSIPKNHLLPESLAAKAKQSELLPSDEAILKCGILSDLDIEITDVDDAAILLDRIKGKKYTAVQVAAAFCKRASIAQQTVNCLTETFYDRALKRAAELDDYLAKEGRPLGPLHGLPVSLKDCYDVADIATTSGLVSWIPNVAKKDSAVAKALLDAGAVLYVKTNVSQGLLMVESINNVFGTTKNPFNLELSAGGSSGGESALVAAKGAIIGTGTDGGGSIRLPASFCGLWGLKCSKGRIPGTGIQAPRDGNESTNPGLGPMARSVSSMELWLQAQLAAKPWEYDHGAIPIPWEETEAARVTKRQTIGVLWDDGVIRPAPPVMRAMRQMVETLKRAGHAVIYLPEEHMQKLHRQALACTMKSNVQSGGYNIKRQLDASGEPVIPRTATGSPDSFLTTQEVFANHMERATLTAEYNELWKTYSLDAILAPSVAHPAPPHGKYVSNGYATVYNMLDYATGCVPVTQTDLELDVASPKWYAAEAYPRIEEKRFPYDWGDKEMKQLYTGPEVYKNGPVGVQFVCRRLREEKLIGILKEVEAIM